MSKTRETIITQTLNDLGVQIDLKTAPLVRCKDCKVAESVNCPMWRAHFGYTDTDFCSMGVPKEQYQDD